MSYGCIPVVPKDHLGAWDEILQEGKYGMGYSNADECASMMTQILSMNKEEFSEASRGGISRTKSFSEERFGSELNHLISKVLG
jgi:hypothetical protein